MPMTGATSQAEISFHAACGICTPGHPSAEALLVAIGGPHLQRLAIPVRDVDSPELEHRLYDSLHLRGSDARSQDNALTPRLVRFERTLDRESERTATGCSRSCDA